MKLFQLRCEDCGNEWHDIYITYICPKCCSKQVYMIEQATHHNSCIVSKFLLPAFIWID